MVPTLRARFILVSNGRWRKPALIPRQATVAAPLVVLRIGVHDPQDVVFGRVLGPLLVRKIGADGVA